VFISNNNSPTVVQAADGTVPGVRLRSDCLYWIDWRCVPMVCDVATRTFKQCADLSYGATVRV
jgi:hypothetical protein